MATKRKVNTEASINNRSRITNGTVFLPCIHEHSVWARTARDSYAAILSDRGGADYVPWTVKTTARHTSVLSTELDFIAAKIGKIREEGGEPEPHLHDLYSRLLNAERRMCADLGYERRQRDVTPQNIRDRLLVQKKEVVDV